jgi:hypothetical protein
MPAWRLSIGPVPSPPHSSSQIGPLPQTFLPQPYIHSSTSSIANSALKMETVCCSETLASTDQPTRRQNPEEHHHPHRRKT